MIKNIKLKIDWLFWFIILLPTFYIVGMDERSAQLQFFQFSVIALLAVMHVNKWFGALLGWCLFQFLFFKDAPIFSGALNNLFLAALAYHIIVLYSEHKEIKKYFKAFYILLGINILLCLRQYYQADPVFMMAEQDHQKVFTEYPGFFGLPAFLGNFTAAVLPLAFSLTPLLLPFCLVALYFSKSTFSVLAALCGGLFYLWFKHRRCFWAFLIIGGLSCGVYVLKYDLPTGQFGRRIEVWKMVERFSFQKQFVGHGIGSFQSQSIFETSPSGKLAVINSLDDFKAFLSEAALSNKTPELLPEISAFKGSVYPLEVKEFKKKLQGKGMDFERWQNVHNDFLEAFFETGFIGLFLIFGFIFDFFKRFIEFGKKDSFAVALMGSLVAIIIVSIGHFPFHMARLGGPFVVLLALLDVALIHNKLDKEEVW